MGSAHIDGHATPDGASFALAVGGLHKTFHAGIPGCTAHADVLCGVELVVRKGEIVGITGVIGSGKSTLLLCAAGLLRADSGSVTVFGQTTPSPLVSYVSLVPAARASESPTQSLARALSTGAHLLLLDGVLTFLSPGARKLIAALAARGMAVVAAERDRTALDTLVERTLVLCEGSLSTHARRYHGQRARSPARVAEPVSAHPPARLTP